MLIATRSFVDPTDGLRIEAGRTRVAKDADVALMYPDRFRDCPNDPRKGQLIRNGGSARVARGSYERSSTPLATLYEDLEPTYQATLGHGAEETIRADIAWTQENMGDVETGGWLLATEGNPDYLLVATVPGTDSITSRSSINLGFEQLEAAQRKYGDAVVGDWHFHCGGDDRPSDTDLRAFTQGAKLARGRWISLIATPSRSWRSEPELNAWITFGPRSDLLITERLKLT